MLVVSVVSLKGGVGKTSVTLGLAGAAWDRGLRTLVIDLDPQANATTVLDPGSIARTMVDVLGEPRPGGLRTAIARSGWGPEVDIAPAERALDRLNAPVEGGAVRLRVAMTGLDGYDLVLIDSPPSLGELTRNALAASHRALVIAEPSLFALQGAQQALEAVEAIRAHNLRLQPAGIVVNRLRAQSTEHRFRMDELHAAYGDLLFDPPVPDRTAIQQSEGACVPVQAWRSQGAREVADAFDDHLDRLLALARSAADAGPLARRSSP